MKVLKYLGYLLLLAVVIIAGLLTYVKTALPNVGEAPELKIESTPERVAHGKYLATSITVCMDCHSKRDFSKFSGPLSPGTLGMGGDRFDQTVGLPGVFYSKNITPEGISRYTDGELFRVITTGVSKEGKAMFPLMPFSYYGRMDSEDIYDIIAYLRTLPSIKNDVPVSEPDFPMNFIINIIPKKGEPQTRPDKKDILAYGSYLTNAAACRECHTQVDNGQIIPEVAFAGGREFMFPNGNVVRSSNITSDTETGIGGWSEEIFIKRFKMYSDSSYVDIPQPSNPGDFNSIMPWTMYANMDEEDLKAIFTYLKTIQPIKNSVSKFTAKKG